MSDVERAAVRPGPDALTEQDGSTGGHDHAAGLSGGRLSHADQRIVCEWERAILRLPCIGTPKGMTVAAIAASIVEDERAVDRAIQELARLNVVEPADSGRGSQRWRLTAH